MWLRERLKLLGGVRFSRLDYSLHLDMHTGALLHDQRASELPAYWRWSETADPLHFGDFAGLWSKTAWFVLGIGLCALVLTGTLLHVQRLAAFRGGCTRHRVPGTAAALAITVAVVAAAVPAALQQARDAYGPLIDGARALPSVAPAVQAMIAAWIAVTLAILTAWVAVLRRPRPVLELVPRRRSART